MKKYDIINALGRRHGLRRYLEICTPTTGHMFAQVDSEWFTTKHRLVYNCPERTDDGLTYTYRTTLPYSHEILRTIDTATNGRCSYDLIFVDPFHTLQSSSADLTGACNMLSAGGIMVVHDCNPTDESMTGAVYQPGNWCGLTYRAFIDFTLLRSDLTYFTVDTDYGCGVIHKQPPTEASVGLARDREALQALWLRWSLAREAEETRYEFFDRHRRDLLNLITVPEFESLLASAPPSPIEQARPAP